MNVRGQFYLTKYLDGVSHGILQVNHYIIQKCVLKSRTFSDASQSFSQAIYFRIQFRHFSVIDQTIIGALSTETDLSKKNFEFEFEFEISSLIIYVL
jgi:hypothetical protein